MNPNQQSAETATTPPSSPSTNNNDTVQMFIPTKNVPALLSYYFGVIGLIPFLGIPFSIAAIVLGKIGLSRYKANPTPGAKPHALIGLILGICEIIFGALFLAFIILILGQG